VTPPPRSTARRLYTPQSLQPSDADPPPNAGAPTGWTFGASLSADPRRPIFSLRRTPAPLSRHASDAIAPSGTIAPHYWTVGPSLSADPRRPIIPLRRPPGPLSPHASAEASRGADRAGAAATGDGDGLGVGPSSAWGAGGTDIDGSGGDEAGRPARGLQEASSTAVDVAVSHARAAAGCRGGVAAAARNGWPAESPGAPLRGDGICGGGSGDGRQDAVGSSMVLSPPVSIVHALSPTAAAAAIAAAANPPPSPLGGRLMQPAAALNNVVAAAPPLREPALSAVPTTAAGSPTAKPSRRGRPMRSRHVWDATADVSLRTAVAAAGWGEWAAVARAMVAAFATHFTAAAV